MEDLEQRLAAFPVPANAWRFVLPTRLEALLRAHPLSRGLYPKSGGFYRTYDHRYESQGWPYHLLYLCTGGQARVRSAAGGWAVATGDLVLIPAGCAHAVEPDATSPWSFYFVGFAGQLAEEYIEFLRLPQRSQRVAPEPALLDEFAALAELRNSDFSITTMVVGAQRLGGLLARLAEAVAAAAQRQSHRIDLQALRRLMHAKLMQGIALSELAQAAGMSAFHFTRCFKQQTGMAPIHYFLQMRMQHACHMLDCSGLSVTEISALMGYDDSHYFSRMFKRVIGLSPTQYRRAGQGTRMGLSPEAVSGQAGRP